MSASRRPKQCLLKAKSALQQWSTAGLIVRFSLTPHNSPRTNSAYTDEKCNADMILKLQGHLKNYVWVDEQLVLKSLATLLRKTGTRETVLLYCVARIERANGNTTEIQPIAIKYLQINFFQVIYAKFLLCTGTHEQPLQSDKQTWFLGIFPSWVLSTPFLKD